MDEVSGAPSNISAANAGAAYVYARAGTTWSEQAYLKAANAQSKDLFGTRLAISGATIVVGAYQANGGAGAAYVFAF